jgi:hypothetical protein
VNAADCRFCVVKWLVDLVLHSGLPLSFDWFVFADCRSNDFANRVSKASQQWPAWMTAGP